MAAVLAATISMHGCELRRNDKYVMAYQQQQLSLLQRVLPSAKKVPGGVKGRLCMTLQDGATTPDILTGILQVSFVFSLPRNECLLQSGKSLCTLLNIDCCYVTLQKLCMCRCHI